jgi:hypothetical protein
MEIVEVSCATCEGLNAWRQWIEQQRKELNARMIAGIA